MLIEMLNIREIIKIKNLIYENIVSNDFKLLDKNSLINIDVTIGCSKSEDKQIKIYAEKALHKAKLEYLHYMYYDSFLYKNIKVVKSHFPIVSFVVGGI